VAPAPRSSRTRRARDTGRGQGLLAGLRRETHAPPRALGCFSRAVTLDDLAIAVERDVTAESNPAPTAQEAATLVPA
jgi:hypothetical protein